MAFSMVGFLFICFSTILSLGFTSCSSLCPPQSHLFLNHLQSQCPSSISPSLPHQVDGEFLDIALSSGGKNAYTAVLFYASWCPFSFSARSKFNALSSMFPQIRHLTVEQSSAMPSVFSRYGIHSLPTLLLVNHTARERYHGPKELGSLALFYEGVTGLEPLKYFTEDHSSASGGSNKHILHWYLSSSKEMLTREPYLVLAILFLCLRAFLYLSPRMLSCLRAFWISCIPHLNLGIFGETTHLLERVFHMIDLKDMWSKVGLSKGRNFQKGAKNARVWASSLTSVSLGESSSARMSPTAVRSSVGTTKR